MSPEVQDLYYNYTQATCGTEYLEKYFQANFSSFENCTTTGAVKINATEACNFVKNFNFHLEKMSKDLSLNKFETVHYVNRQLEMKKVLLKPEGFSAFVDRSQLLMVGAGSSIYSSSNVAVSSVSGTTGVAVLQATPLLVITVPTLFGIGFGACERVFYGSPAGNLSCMLKGVCLTPLRFTEIVYNHCCSPIFSRFGIDAQLNFTSYLTYGLGITPDTTKTFMATVKEPKFWKHFTTFFSKTQ